MQLCKTEIQIGGTLEIDINKNSEALVPSGILGFDQIVYGGIVRGNAVIIEGSPGIGKTIFALEFIYRGASLHNEAGLILSLETSVEKIKQDALGFGLDCQKLENQNKMKILKVTPAQIFDNLQLSTNFVTTEIKKINARRVVIDNLTPLKEYLEARQGPSFRESLHMIIDTFERMGVMPVFVAETMAKNAIEESQFLCDTVISLRNSVQRRSSIRTLEIVKSRGQNFISGTHSYKIFPQKGIEVFPRISAGVSQKFSQKTSIKKSSFCNPTLDEMLGGGVLEGSTTLCVGISGTGKSILGMEFLAAGVAQGKKGLLVTLDEHPEQICRNADELKLKLSTHVKSGDVTIYYNTPMEIDLDEHFYRIKNIIEQKDITRIVIDSLATYQSAHHEETHDFIFALTSLFKYRMMESLVNYECPELLGVSQISSSLKASAMADNIILLNYVEISTIFRRAITVPKVRGGKPAQRTREYMIMAGGIVILDDKTSDVDLVPQLPLSSYYGVLARSPTRHSPIIDEYITAGKKMPKSKVPKPIIKTSKTKTP